MTASTGETEASTVGGGGADRAGTAPNGSPAGARTLEVIETGRWTGISALAFLAGGVGIAARSPGLLLAALVGVVFMTAARLSRPPTVDLAIERTFDDEAPDPGESVTVTLAVENRGDGTLWDLRILDAVAPELVVEEGTASRATALRPGATTALSYTVTAKRGRHEFGDPVAVARSVSGTHERVVALPAEGVLTARQPLEARMTVPLRTQGSRFTGRVETANPGEGVEFFATREYRSGDALSRIDWKRYARGGDLATILFREERMATVVLMLDLRASAYVRGDGEGPHAADRTITAAGSLFPALLDTGDRVGIAALSHEDVWLAPATGTEHRARARELLATHPALSPTPPEATATAMHSTRQLMQRVPPDAQVVLLSPLADDGGVEIARLLDARGHPVTVISPDATSDEDVSDRVGRLNRSLRITRLRKSAIRVIDWHAEESLPAALEHARRRWSR